MTMLTSGTRFPVPREPANTKPLVLIPVLIAVALIFGGCVSAPPPPCSSEQLARTSIHNVLTSRRVVLRLRYGERREFVLSPDAVAGLVKIFRSRIEPATPGGGTPSAGGIFVADCQKFDWNDGIIYVDCLDGTALEWKWNNDPCLNAISRSLTFPGSPDSERTPDGEAIKALDLLERYGRGEDLAPGKDTGQINPGKFFGSIESPSIAFGNGEQSGLFTRTGEVEGCNFWDSPFTADGTRIITSKMDEVRVWDTASLKATTKWLHHDKVIWMQLSSDGKTAFTGSETDLRLWDVATSSVRFEKKSGGKTIRFAAINPDASRMLTVFRDNSATAELWDAGSGRRVGKLLHKSPIVYARFDSAGKKLVTCELAGGRPFHLWDAKTGDALSKPIASDFVTESQDAVRAAFGANNKRCVFARQNGFAIADSTTGEILLTGHLDGNVETDSVAFAADGGKIALLTRSAVDHERSAVQVFDARTGKLVCSVASGTAWCDISPDGGRLLCGMTERPAELWDIDKGRKLQSFLGNVAYDAAANWQANIIAFGVDDHTSIWRHARK